MTDTRAPLLASVPRIPDEALQAYRLKGYTVLRGLFDTDEIAEFRQEAMRLAANDDGFDQETRGIVRNSPTRTDRIEPLLDVSPVFAAVAADPRIVGAAEAMLGPGVQLLKDKLILKPPGAQGYGVHQDLAYWHELGIAGHDALTVALGLDRSTPEAGAIELAPECHDALLTPPGVVCDPDESTLPPFETVSTEPGDLLVFSALAPHRSGPNRSSAARRMLFLTFGRDSRPNLRGRFLALRQTF